MNFSLVLVAAISSLLLLPAARSRDPNYAVELSVTTDNEEVHNFRVVSLQWLDYLARSERQTRRPLIYYKIESVPDLLSVGTFPGPRFRRYDAEPSAKRELVAQVFEQVLEVYMFDVLGLKISAEIHADAVDPVGVAVNGGRHQLNRTIVVSFEDPPYGQSRINRLVTNRNIRWVVWNGVKTENIRFRPSYNMTEDLIYRYFHNIGHLLGFGHYVESHNSKNALIAHRSVMFANYKDSRFSAPTPLKNGVDVRVMRKIMRSYPELIKANVERFIGGEVSASLFYLIKTAARLA
jgi:hypothetical protein